MSEIVMNAKNQIDDIKTLIPNIVGLLAEMKKELISQGFSEEEAMQIVANYKVQ